MKKSEVRLIITGIASLVVSILLGIATVIAFVINTGTGLAENKSSITNGINSIGDTIESMSNDISGVVSDVNTGIEELEQANIELS